MADRGLQKEAQERLQGFMQQLRGSQAADLSGKRLQDEGLCYICEAIAFNDRWAHGVVAGLGLASSAMARPRQNLLCGVARLAGKYSKYKTSME